MADDVGMTLRRHQDEQEQQSFAEIAKEELALSAMAFFAPVVGAVSVMCDLWRATSPSGTSSSSPDASSSDCDKRDAA